MALERTIQSYGSGITAASKSVLLELTQVLGSYRDALVLVGGWVPYFLLEECQRPEDSFVHIGSIDIDLAVDPGKIDNSRYATIVELLEGRNYRPATDRLGNPIPFIFQRTVNSPADNRSYEIRVDFLTHEQDPRPGKHRHLPVQDNLLARKARGCKAAFNHAKTIKLSGVLPNGSEITVPLQMADVVGCLTMKGIVLGERYREKDAYDIYAVVAHYRDGPLEVADIMRPHISKNLVKDAIASIHDAFATRRANGPAWVADFLQPASLDERERLITDAFMTVSEFVSPLYNPEHR